MKTVRGIDAFVGSAPVHLAAGCFDGLHIGHRAVVRTAVERAAACGGEAWVFTLAPHPARVLDPDHAPPLLFTTGQLLIQLKEAGVTGCLFEPFTETFMQQDPADFFDALCEHIPTLAGISVGEDWSFGHNRQGTADRLAALCAQQKIDFSACPTVRFKGERVSSTRLREAVQIGQLDDVTGMLGRPYGTVGTVVHGEQIGRRLGFPTANIDPENELLPPRGIYAAQLRIGSRLHPAAAYIGHRGTFHDNRPQVLEVHLLDTGPIDLYGRNVEVLYHAFIRGDRIFESPERLREQILEDLEKIRRILR